MTQHLHRCAECQQLAWHESGFHAVCLQCHNGAMPLCEDCEKPISPVLGETRCEDCEEKWMAEHGDEVADERAIFNARELHER